MNVHREQRAWVAKSRGAVKAPQTPCSGVSLLWHHTLSHGQQLSPAVCHAQQMACFLLCFHEHCPWDLPGPCPVLPCLALSPLRLTSIDALAFELPIRFGQGPWKAWTETNSRREARHIPPIRPPLLGCDLGLVAHFYLRSQPHSLSIPFAWDREAIQDAGLATSASNWESPGQTGMSRSPWKTVWQPLSTEVVVTVS